MTNELQVKQKVTIAQLVHNEEFVKKANDVLGKNTQQFMSSILSLVNSDKNLAACDPIKLYNVCLMSAAVGLPVNQNLGQAYIIAYKGEPQLQIGWKGFVQLAQRSGQFRTINVSDVRKGEIEKFDRLTGEITFNWIEEGREKAEVIGYVGFFELINGFRKTFYMTKDELEKHAKKYSQTYRSGFGVWKDNFDAMARKTVIKLLLSKYGPLSVEMQKAVELDQSDEEGKYPDNNKVDIVDAEFGDSEEDLKER